MITSDLFEQLDINAKYNKLGEGTILLPNFIVDQTLIILQMIKVVVQQAPFRVMSTPNGHKMAVSVTSCGDKGWVSDHTGYRYTKRDPLTGNNWPIMPDILKQLAIQAAKEAGYSYFNPESCFINRYKVGDKLSLHQDKDEKNLTAPIVSFSLGLPAIFLWGGLLRTDRTKKIPLMHGDVLVWGGKDRLRFHGVLPIDKGHHQLLGEQRINLTFRQID